MTCSNCGSTAIQPNGYCATCGQPAAAPQTGWSAPGPTAGYNYGQPAGEYPPAGQYAAAADPPPYGPPSGQLPPPASGQPPYAQPAAGSSPYGPLAGDPPPYAPTAGDLQPPYAPPPAPHGTAGQYPADGGGFSAPPAPYGNAAPPPGGPPYVNAAQPAYGAPQNAPYGAPPPYNPYPPMAPRAAGNNFSIAAFVMAGVGFLLIPLLGILGIVFGAVTLRRGERLGKLGLIVAIVGTVLGFAASAALRLF